MANSGSTNQSTKTTTIFHLDGKRFMGRTPDGQQLMIDGESYAKTGMNPMEVLLNALGACAAFDTVEMIRKRRLELVSYRVHLEGDRHDGTPAYYTHIRATHHINAPGLKQEMAERFVDLATNKYCSVASSLKADIAFDVILEHDLESGS
jgi:putative redox protein